MSLASEKSISEEFNQSSEYSRQFPTTTNEVLAKIQQQYLPNLRKQIHEQVYKQLQKNKQQLLAQKTDQIKNRYMSRLQEDIKQININIQQQMHDLQQQISVLKQQSIRIPEKCLSSSEESSIIQNIVEQICNDSHMLHQIVIKMKPKVEERIKQQLEDDLEFEIEEYKKQLEEQLAQNRKNWQKQRMQYWHEKSREQLGVLAKEYEELENKKKMIQGALSKKKKEREEINRQYNQLCDKNQEIAAIKRQIKSLKQ